MFTWAASSPPLLQGHMKWVNIVHEQVREFSPQLHHCMQHQLKDLFRFPADKYFRCFYELLA